MAISERTYKFVWGMFAARCAICQKTLVHEGGKRAALLGEVAHIVGEKIGAPRGRVELAPDARNQPENLLLLCRDHHKLIDDNEIEYSVEKLRAIRQHHLNWLATRLGKIQPWRSSISQLTYINVPRLSELAELQGFEIDLRSFTAIKSLRSMGWELTRLMALFEQTLHVASLTAIPSRNIEFAHEKYIGAVISFDRQRFRTKSIPVIGDDTSQQNNHGVPHIYAQFTSWTLVLNIDPKWITTATSFSLLRPPGGQVTFSGLARLSNVDYELCQLTGTPLAFGLPKSEFDEKFWSRI